MANRQDVGESNRRALMKEFEAEDTRPVAPFQGDLSRPLFTAASRVGDLIFMYDKGGSGAANRAFQSFARGAFVRDRALYSHVAIVAGHGMLIHADGTSTRYQLMAEVAPRGRPTADFRIVRRSPPLTEDEEARLGAALGKHDGQDYYFGFGAFALSRKLAAGEREITMPICSELATIGYRAIGVPLAEPRQAAEVFPLDLDMATRGDGWEDVTDLYYPEPLPALLPDGTPLNFPADPDMSAFAKTDLMIAETRRVGFEALVSVLGYSEAVRSINSENASCIHHNAAAMIEFNPELCIRLVRNIDALYDKVIGYPVSLMATPLVDGQVELFPAVPESQAVYEGQPTFAELRPQEQAHEISEFVHGLIKASGLMAALEGMGSGAIPKPATESAVRAAIPPLSGERLQSVEAGLVQLRDAMGDDPIPALVRGLIDDHLAVLARP